MQGETGDQRDTTDKYDVDEHPQFARGQNVETYVGRGEWGHS